MALFDHAQEQALGPLLRDYLRSKAQYLQHLALQDQAAGEEARMAQERWDAYTAEHSAADAQASPLALDADALDALKQLYRKLAMQCHPDRVADADQDRAAQFFQSLQSSYRRGDMAALFALQESVARAGFQALSTDLPEQDAGAAQQAVQQGVQAGVHDGVQDAAPDSAQRDLLTRLRLLHSALAQRHDALQTLRNSPTWRTLSSQPNWDVWFAQQQQYLQSELQRFGSALPAQSTGAVPVMPDPGAAVPHV